MEQTSAEQVSVSRKLIARMVEPERNKAALICVLAAALIPLLVNLNGWSVLEASEARYAEISREMFRSGNWLHPSLLNIWHYHKPPVVFWLTSLGFQLFGVNALGARFFLQISLLVQVALVYGIATQLSRPLAIEISHLTKERSEGLNITGYRIPPSIAALIYLSFPLSILSARNLTTDCFLTTFVLATVYCTSVYYCQRKVWGIYGSAIAIGFGFLTKGPAIFVIPFFFWLYLMLVRQENYRVPIKHLLFACALCLGIGLSWYVYVSGEVSGLGDYFIGKQVVARVADEEAFDRAQPFWYYPLILLTTTLPWGIACIVSLLPYRQDKRAELPIGRHLTFYWLLMPLVIFSLSSSKLMFYLLPIYPGIAIVLAYALTQMAPAKLIWLNRIFFGFYELLGLLALVGVFIAQQLGANIAITLPMVAIALLLIVVPPIINLLLSQSPQLCLSLMACASMLALTFYSSYFLQANELLVGGTTPLAQFIKTQGLQDRPVLVYNKLLPSLAFNLDRDIITINDEDARRQIERELQFQTDDSWQQYWVYSREPKARAYLEEIARSPSTLVTRGETPERWRWLLESYPQSADIGRWRLFYRLPAQASSP